MIVKNSHNTISALCRYALVKAKVCRSEKTIPMKPWDWVIWDFAKANTGAELTSEGIIDKFQKEAIVKYKRDRKRAARMRKAKLALTAAGKH